MNTLILRMLILIYIPIVHKLHTSDEEDLTIKARILCGKLGSAS